MNPSLAGFAPSRRGRHTLGMNLIEQLRVKVAQDQFEFSQHAADQSILRQISVQEIREVSGAGEVIEHYPQDK